MKGREGTRKVKSGEENGAGSGSHGLANSHLLHSFHHTHSKLVIFKKNWGKVALNWNPSASGKALEGQINSMPLFGKC